MNKTNAKKYLAAIKKINKKCVTSEQLSRSIGIYPEIINEQLAIFEPMLAMDPSYNLKDLIPAIEDYIKELEESSVKKVYFESKKNAGKYKSVSDFVYQKMTISGLVDRNKNLSEEDLKILRRLVNDELDDLKNHK